MKLMIVYCVRIMDREIMHAMCPAIENYVYTAPVKIIVHQIMLNN
jgi:hypothetical protein